MSQPFVGQVMMAGFNFAPKGFAFCDGRLLGIAQNQALFSLLGTTYGGDGVTTFALPDLRGRVSNHFGQGPGLANYTLGEKIGTENVTLLVNNLPPHNHMVRAGTGGGLETPQTNYPGTDTSGTGAQFYGAATNTAMSPQMIANAGGSQPHNNMQPYLVINFCIALQGIFPSRN